MTGPFYIARHGETVFNAAARMQGDAAHTPLTRAGFAQAEEMGEAMRARLGAKPELILWASPTGRALQTLAIIAEHLELDWHGARTDARLAEMNVGAWGGRFFRAIHASEGEFVDRERGLFTRRPPDGEWYVDVADRLQSWLEEQAPHGGGQLIVMHGISSRVLRAILTRAAPASDCGAPVADALPQGSIVRIVDGVETVLHRGSGGFGASRAVLPA